MARQISVLGQNVNYLRNTGKFSINDSSAIKFFFLFYVINFPFGFTLGYLLFENFYDGLDLNYLQFLGVKYAFKYTNEKTECVQFIPIIINKEILC